MTKIDISSNELCAAGGKALAEALKNNQVVTELNISSNYLGTVDGGKHKPDMSGVVALANVIPDMGALSVTNVMGNKIGKEQLAKLQESMRSKPNLVSLCGIADDATEADLSGLNMDADDTIVLASELPDKRAISSVNLLKNVIGTDQAKALVSILKAHPTLKSLCGNTGSETELNMSGKIKGAADAIMLVPEIIDNGAMTSLNLASNNLGSRGAKIVAEAIKVNKV
jgi:Ran GTPase-activating protein (RanGAP) involved in mRNA processing and transport